VCTHLFNKINPLYTTKTSPSGSYLQGLQNYEEVNKNVVITNFSKIKAGLAPLK